MDTQTQIDRLIELAIIQRSELKQLVEQLPQLREHLNAEVEKVFEETEPQLRAELEDWTTKQTSDKAAALGAALEAKITDLAKSLEISTQARYNAIIAEREENTRLAAQAEQKIAEHAASLPSAVKDIVTAELARFPRAGEIDQLRKEFAEPKSLNPRGKWQAGETYNKLDLVTINGDSYTSAIDGNKTRPTRSSADWTLVAARGTGGGGGPTSLTDLTAVPQNGELLIGNGSAFVNNTLTAGTGVTITNGAGTITIDASGAQELLTATVKNADSVAITKGQVVYLFGATGGFPSVKLANNTSDATSNKTFGVVSDTSIAPNGTGTVTCVGVVDGLNLAAYNDGDAVYLGASAGTFTATKPYAPNHLVFVGIVERANMGNGELYVRIQNGYELEELHNVQITTPPLAGSLLMYDATNSLWKANRLTGGTNIAVTNADTSVTLGLTGTVAVANGGTGVTTSTGTGSVVLSNTPTLVTPNIGAATGTSVNLSGAGTFGGNLTVSGTGPHSFSGRISVTNASGAYAGSFINTDATTAPGLYVQASRTTDSALLVRNASDSSDLLRVTNSGGTVIGGNLTVSGTGTSSVGGILNIGNGSNLTYALANGSNSGTGGGANFLVQNAGTSIIGLGNKSSFIGGAYSADATLWYAGTLNFVAGSTVYATLTNTGNAAFAGNLTVSGTGTSTFGGSVRLPWGTATLLSYFDATYSLGFAFDSTNRKLVLRAQSGDAPANGKGTIAFETGATPSEIARFAPSTGNFLLKSDGVDSSNGRIQLATHTTSAGGIGFGTDISLYRPQAGVLAIDGSQAALYLRDSGTTKGRFNVTGSTLYIDGVDASGSTGQIILRTGNGGTTALTLNSSGDATFAGNVAIQSGKALRLYNPANSAFASIEMDSNNVVNVNYTTAFGVTIRTQGGTASTPASASAAGVAGTIQWDANYIYVCTAVNTWKRVAIATWP